MTLVERFIDFRDWPTSRKSALAGAIVVPGLLFILVALVLVHPPAVDVTMLVQLFLFGVVIGSAIGAMSWIAYRRGKDGRWTGYAFIFTYQLWVVLVAVALGGFTSPFVAFPLFLPFFTVLWWGVRMGAVSAGCIIAVLTAGGVLNLTGVVPLAPAMQIRNLDGLNTVNWLAVSVATFFLIAVWTYGVAFVAVAAADLQHRRLALAHGLIRRYVPEQVADAVLSGAPESIDRHERRKLTIFFSDLVGFTALSDELEPEDLAVVLHDYFTEMSAIANRHSGTVDDLVGDAILVLFGAPERTDDHDQALRAVRMAVEMQEAMGPLNRRWATAGIPETLSVRMGVNTGVATVGNFGSAERTKYTALGKQVNIAARIQSHCEPGKVLIGHATWLLVGDEIPCTPKGELTLKGLHKPMPAYEVQN
jgi:class 3 adenylate cyclase